MSGLSIIAVFGGAGAGALFRWRLGAWLDPLFPSLPLGTLAANLLGGLMVGAASAFFTHNGTLAPEWRLLVVTGFLGGLTTFSSFSIEVVTLFGRQEHGWALAAVALHLVGSLLLALLGLLIGNALFVRA